MTKKIFKRSEEGILSGLSRMKRSGGAGSREGLFVDTETNSAGRRRYSSEAKNESGVVYPAGSEAEVRDLEKYRN